MIYYYKIIHILYSRWSLTISIPVCMSLSLVHLSFFLFCFCDHLKPITPVSLHFNLITPIYLCELQTSSLISTHHILFFIYVIPQPTSSM